MGRRKAFDDEVTAEYSTGASGVHVAPTEPAPYVEERLFEDNLLGSIPLDALTVEFQPVVDLRTGATCGFEALPRCRVDGLGDPAQLFARAGFEKTVGDLGAALRAIASRECMGTALYLAVHPAELKYGNLVRPDDPIAMHDAPVWLQLSQASLPSLASQIMRELGGRSGVHLVLVDFGAGPATLKQVIELEPDAIKIDRELIAGLDKSHRKRAVVTAIASLCNELGAMAIAKGVDCEAEYEAIQQCGVRVAQGFLLGEPAPLPTISLYPPGR